MVIRARETIYQVKAQNHGIRLISTKIPGAFGGVDGHRYRVGALCSSLRPTLNMQCSIVVLRIRKECIEDNN
jgi:hypothetical protein